MDFRAKKVRKFATTNTYKFTVVRRQVVTAQRLICGLTAPNPSPSFRDVIFLHENDLGQTEVFFHKKQRGGRWWPQNVTWPRKANLMKELILPSFSVENRRGRGVNVFLFKLSVSRVCFKTPTENCLNCGSKISVTLN